MKMKEMNPDEFAIFRKKTADRRSKYHETEAGLSHDAALVKAQEEFAKHCPQGMKTNQHFFYNLILAEGSCAGYLWFAIRERHNSKRLFINDIQVEESLRGRGLSKFMLTWLEEKAKELGISEIGLHVLGGNTVARTLYEKMGYSVTNLDMAKKLPAKREQ